MRVFIMSLCLAVLAGCSSSGGYTRPIDDSQAKTIFIEESSYSEFGIMNRVELALIEHGFQPVSKEDRARFRLKITFDTNKYNMTATARITEAATGDTVYIGEGKNKGFGTMIARGEAMAGCVDRALANLKR